MYQILWSNLGMKRVGVLKHVKYFWHAGKLLRAYDYLRECLSLSKRLGTQHLIS